MSRRRMIDPSIWEDEDVGQLSDRAFRLFIACISNADDEGRLQGSAVKLRGIAFGFSDDVTTQDVADALIEIESRIRGFARYTSEGRDCIALSHWKRYQRVDHPQASKLPPPLDSQNDIGTFSERPKKKSRTIADDSTVIEDSIREVSIREEKTPKASGVDSCGLLKREWEAITKQTLGSTSLPDRQFINDCADKVGVDALKGSMREIAEAYKSGKGEGRYPGSMAYVLGAWKKEPPTKPKPAETDPNTLYRMTCVDRIHEESFDKNAGGYTISPEEAERIYDERHGIAKT